jgi:hypothetical protein
MKQIGMTQTVNINFIIIVEIVPKAPKLNHLSIISQELKTTTRKIEQLHEKS